MFCFQCGAQAPDHAGFCSMCGCALRSVPQPGPHAVPPASTPPAFQVSSEGFAAPASVDPRGAGFYGADWNPSVAAPPHQQAGFGGTGENLSASVLPRQQPGPGGMDFNRSISAVAQQPAEPYGPVGNAPPAAAFQQAPPLWQDTAHPPGQAVPYAPPVSSPGGGDSLQPFTPLQPSYDFAGINGDGQLSPPGKGSLRTRMILLCVLLCLVAGGTVLLFGFNGAGRLKEMAAAPAAQEALPGQTALSERPDPAPQPGESAGTISASELAQAFNANAANAEALYKGKAVVITGVVDTVGEDIYGQAYVSVSDGTGFSLEMVYCSFTGDDSGAVEPLSGGDLVSIQGICNGKGVLSGATLTDCRLLSTETPSDVPSPPTPLAEPVEPAAEAGEPADHPEVGASPDLDFPGEADDTPENPSGSADDPADGILPVDFIEWED